MAGPTVSDEMELTFEDGVAHIALNRPDKLNALTRTLMDSIGESLRWAAVAPEVRAILISGKGRMFCSGDDLDGLGSVHGAGPSPATEVFDGPYPLMHKLLTTRKPVIAAVQGGAYVAGLDIALAADYRIASAETKLGPIGMTLGGAGGMSLLPMYLPIAKIRSILFRAQPIKGQEALALGLVDEIVETDQILVRAKEVAALWAEGPTLAYGATKSALLSMASMSPLAAVHMEQDYAMAGYATHDAKEAMVAWQERRKPVFKGE